LKTKLFTMRVSEKWITKMRTKALRRSRKEDRDISVADLIREACRILYKVKD
jgi:hypothetical protein